MGTTDQLRNFFGVEEWGFTKGAWGDRAEESAIAVKRHDSYESHIDSIRQLNKPLPRTRDGRVDYTSKDVYDVARQDNVEKNLAANFWQETASLLRWATTFSLAAIALAVSGGTFSVALGVGAVAAAAVAGAGLFYASRKARKLGTEKGFDDSEFKNQRHAQLVGQAVEQERENAGTKVIWQERVGRDVQAGQNWQENVQQALEDNTQAGPAI